MGIRDRVAGVEEEAFGVLEEVTEAEPGPLHETCVDRRSID